MDRGGRDGPGSGPTGTFGLGFRKDITGGGLSARPAKMLPRSALPDPKLVDVVDDEWMEDKLPDDDVVLPEGVAPPSDEQEEETEPHNMDPTKERWQDLGVPDTI